MNFLFLLQSISGIEGTGISADDIVRGGIAVILLVIWIITFKYLANQLEKATLQNASQFKTALEQNQKQFQDALTQNQKTNDKIFSILQEDVKYKSLLAENSLRTNMMLEKIVEEQQEIKRKLPS